MKIDPRSLTVYGYVGYNGSGKTTLLKRKLEGIKQGKPWIVRAIFEKNQSIESRYVDVRIDKKNVAHVLDKIKNGVVVIDDLKMLFPSAQAMEPFDEFFGKRRSMNNELWLSVHTANRIPNQVASYLNSIFVFYNQQNSKTKDDIPCHEKIDFATEYINNYVSKFNFKDMEDYTRKFYPKFPYIQINTFTGVMTKYNFR